MAARRGLIVSTASVAGFLLLWQVLADAFVDPFFLPTPTTIFAGLGELLREGILFEAIGVSLGRIVLGWLLGSALAIPVGLLVGASSLVKSVIDPFIHFFRFIPAIALVTLFIVWFGVGEISKVLLITYATGFIVMINTASGVTAIPKEKLDAARTLGARPWQVFLRVIVPATVPFVYVGMRLAMASSFLVIVAAEMLAARSGLGYLIWTSRLYFRIDWMFAGIILLGLLGFLTDRLWRLLGSLFMRRFLRETLQY
jgi:ABC-type nitrate/sulfonate/bicarbonate transport system permease component